MWHIDIHRHSCAKKLFKVPKGKTSSDKISCLYSINVLEWTPPSILNWNSARQSIIICLESTIRNTRRMCDFFKKTNNEDRRATSIVSFFSLYG